jgi:5-deoxy-glucuronate isomerase
MGKFLKAYDNKNQAIVPGGEGLLPLTYFNILKLNKGDSYTLKLPGFESVWVVASGNVDLRAGSDRFKDIGRRKNIWDGQADSIYVGQGHECKVTANMDGTELLIAGGKCEESHPDRHIPPSEVEMVDVGSPGTHSRRRIYHILGNKDNGRAGNLLVSELYADDGCWAGYPPHKHDTEDPPHETSFEELYHYRFNPDHGFGAQFLMYADGSADVFQTRQGDSVLLPKGYHPTVTAPGYQKYVFTILVGREQRSLVQRFHEQHKEMAGKIPGIGDMVNKFK